MRTTTGEEVRDAILLMRGAVRSADPEVFDELLALPGSERFAALASVAATSSTVTRAWGSAPSPTSWQQPPSRRVSPA